jgi:hypothetical protein
VTAPDVPGQVWLVGGHDFERDLFTPLAVFVDQADATAYADLVDGDIRAVPVYRPQSGHPEVVTIWRCRAVASADPAVDHPPVTFCRTLPASGITEQDRQPARFTASQERDPFAIRVIGWGTDRERVEAGVRERYDHVRDGVVAAKRRAGAEEALS